MRKQDRLAAERQQGGQQSRQQQPDRKNQADPRGREQVRGNADSEQPARPQRQSGERMPLPE